MAGVGAAHGRDRGPLLIVFMGLPGAGKSTLARALCRRLGYERVDRDAIRAGLFPAARFTAGEKAAANAAVWRTTAERLRRRRNVVIDGMTFASAAQRRRGRSVARKLHARYVEVFVDCPPELAQRRVRLDRAHPAGDRSARLVREVAARFAPVSRTAIRIDARRSPRAQLRELLGALALASCPRKRACRSDFSRD